MKTCSTCKVRPVRSGGQSTCRGCHNEYQKAYYKANPRSINVSSQRRKVEIRALIAEAKSGPCMDCGFLYPSYVMDLDHVRGEKKFILAIAATKFRSLEVVREELSKCDVVCANCHRIRTFTRNSGVDKR